MSMVPIMLMMMHQQNQRNMHMMQENQRRREAERRRRREEEERKEEEKRKMIKHRKESAVVYNEESWQRDRCVKAISLQPCVQSLVQVIEKVRPRVIESEEAKYDKEIIQVGYEYEQVRQELDDIMETLKKSGISINGDQYRLSRLSPMGTNLVKPEQVTEFLGSTFTIDNGQSIELNSRILSDASYFEDRYQAMNPESLEKEYMETGTKVNRYQKFGKYLRFLLRTRKYLELESKFEGLTEKHETCETRKREMESFQSLTKEQLIVIRTYFERLAQLTEISNRLQKLFSSKRHLRDADNQKIYELSINEVISNGQYSELVEQVRDYVMRIQTNDEETMQKATEQVRGEYPIHVSSRFVYDLIISSVNKLGKEDVKELKLRH